MSEETPKSQGGLGDLAGKAGDLAGKAKEFFTDEKIDEVAGKIKEFTPDSIDKHVDTLAEKAKDAND